jgi:cell division protein FtsI (penicillin-binding protein 3)
MAYGYGVSFTPLQILTFYNAIANKGEMVKPRFLNQISHFGNSPTQVFSKQVLNPSICSDETLRKVNKMMFNVVDKDWGTAHSIKDPLLTMAGKTGTGQVDYATKNIQYISSFVGYYPVEKPKYSSIVVIHKPNKSIGYYGATVAAPVFKTIAKKIFNNIPYEVKVPKKEIQTLNENLKKIVPNVAGLSEIEAVQILKKIGLKVKVKGSGSVKLQSLKPGTLIQNKQNIILELS